MERKITDSAGKKFTRFPAVIDALPRKIKSLRTIMQFRFNSALAKIESLGRADCLPEKLSMKGVVLNSHVVFDSTTILSFYQFKLESVCHIGAHRGQEAESYNRFGVSKAIFIEPIPEIFSELTNVLRGYPNYSALNFAVGNENRQVRLNLASNEFQSSSILFPDLHLKEAPNVTFTESIMVPMRRLDYLLSKEDFPEYLIIDVQGYELQVLMGAVESLDNAKFLFLEVNRKRTYFGCATIEEIDTYLEKFGFVRVLTRWWTIWGDALFVKRTLLPIETPKNE